MGLLLLVAFCKFLLRNQWISNVLRHESRRVLEVGLALKFPIPVAGGRLDVASLELKLALQRVSHFILEPGQVILGHNDGND